MRSHAVYDKGYFPRHQRCENDKMFHDRGNHDMLYIALRCIPFHCVESYALSTALQTPYSHTQLIRTTPMFAVIDLS